MNEHRVSGYSRVDRDAYQTIEPWVTDALRANAILPNRLWEPASGDGHMVAVLRARGHTVVGTDISIGHDFLEAEMAPWAGRYGIVTNPPFGPRGATAQAFAWKALEFTKEGKGMVALLLPSDYDHAATRVGLFRVLPYCRRINLLSRPRWFKGGASPKTNFCWHVWDWRNQHMPTVTYGWRSSSGD